MHRAVPDPVGARTDDRWIFRHIRAAAGPVHAHAGYENAFGAGRVDQRERNDRRHLLQQAQAVDPVPVVRALGPGKLHHPAELIAYSIRESLYPLGCRAGLNLKPFIEIDAIVAKGEPGFGCRPSTSGVTTATNSVTKYFMNRERRGRVTEAMSDSSGSEPTSGVPTSFDHPIGAKQDGGFVQVEAELLSRPEVHDQFESRGLKDREIGGLFAAQDPVGIGASQK